MRAPIAWWRWWWCAIGLLIGADASMGQGALNRPPHFVHGSDMARLAISESTPPGSPVYRLEGEDPEGSGLHYSISGEYFNVNRDTGVVRLTKALDRETQDLIEVIISITDEGVAGSEPNTVSLRREIAVLDENDNAPVWQGRPYAARVPESARIGGLILPPETIVVTDQDGGVNADVRVYCTPASQDDDACQIFMITTEKLGEGKYDVRIILSKPLDFERRNSYLINLVGVDGASEPSKRLQAKATVAVDVLDVQDRPPSFVNAPYSTALPENTGAGHTVLTIRAKDGDTGDPRPLLLGLEEDEVGYFQLEVSREGEYTLGRLVTTNVSLDREDPEIMQNGGIYTFHVRASELINGRELADSSISQVTIVVTDVDDMVPQFSQDEYRLKISEDIGTETPLPGLNMVVIDEDMGENAKFELALRDSPNFPELSEEFVVTPEVAHGRVSVIIKARHQHSLDYDIPEDINKELEFEVVAIVDGEVVSYATVHIDIIDANDHSPQFSKAVYKLMIPENAEVGSKFGKVYAYDRDSGDFGKLSYSLRGFGAEKFSTDPRKGGIYVAQPLDYEHQKSYSLTLEAKDGGGKLSAVNVLIELEDVNDNKPMFEKKEYSRIVREGASSFDPQLFVRASDADGPTQGNGKITYSLRQVNATEEEVFKINPDSGELTITHPVKSGDTERGIYELVIRATDHGNPPVSSETTVYVRVGVPGNQKPIFRGNHKPNLPGPSSYRARVLENAPSGTEVIRVVANDPDGRDSLLQYQLASGAKDNFVINSSSGVISVSPDARLDLESGGDEYRVVVHAVDSGLPIRETATTTLIVTIVDVNNKPPEFKNSTYLAYVSEKAAIGESVVRVKATDPDSDASLEYSIVEPIRAVDKTGAAVKTVIYDYKSAFRINATTGIIYVNQGLDYQNVAVVILTVQARDVNAAVNKDRQIAFAEVSIFVQAYSDDNPTFTNIGWSPNNPTIRLAVPEEQPIGTTLLTLEAKEPMTGYAVQRFEAVRNVDDNNDFINVGLQSGNVVLSKRLDYENLQNKSIKMKVRAFTRDYEITRRMSEVNLVIDVQDINDNGPVFSQKDYKVAILESERPPKIVLQVKATDDDSSATEVEKKRGFGVVRYALTGENANMFNIEPTNGNIRISENTTLDREKQSVLRFYVVAYDVPDGGADQKTARVSVVVDILDVNDNVPVFPRSAYTAVIPENALTGTSVLNVTASDSDEGTGGLVHYEIIDETGVNNLFKINHTTGEITSAQPLTGKGRTEPYYLRIRAQDSGEPPLYTDVDLHLYVGDVVSNDGVPLFIRPSPDESAHISENSTIGSPVFQVVASDPDDPNLPNGRISFRFLEDQGTTESDASSFRLNSETGLITTAKLLDREIKDTYSLVLVAQDHGDPPQQTTRILQVRVTDVDDHKPRFRRGFYTAPLELDVEEEVTPGTLVGVLEAEDEDIGDNGMIDYIITYGNENGVFTVERLQNNSAAIRTNGRIDRETVETYLLTIKCFKYDPRLTRPDVPPKPYNRQDPSERQVSIRVRDMDDNLPRFKRENFTVGVRLNVPIDTGLVTLEAFDMDSNALPINYGMGKAAYVNLMDPTKSKREVKSHLTLNPSTGEIRTTGLLSDYADGFLEVPVTANNSAVAGRQARATLRVFLLKDSDMLKFVFTKSPVEVRRRLEEFEKLIAQALSLPVTVNVYDTQFYAKEDGSLDFSSTSSCFQVVGKESYSIKDIKVLLMDPKNEELKRIYRDFHVDKVTNCATNMAAKAQAFKTQMTVLGAVVLVGVAAITAVCTICCMHAKYKKRAKHARLRDQPRPTLSYVSSAHGVISAGSHTTLGPGIFANGSHTTLGPGILKTGSHTTLGSGAIIPIGMHDCAHEWGHSETALYHPSTLSRT